MLYLQWKKTNGLKYRLALIVFMMLVSMATFAQKEIYREEQDTKPYYFGLTLSTVYTHFQMEHDPSFIRQDTIAVVQSINSPGISLRLVGALNLTNRFELRFNPGLIFTTRPIVYNLKYPDYDQGYTVTKNVESIITTFPLDIKFKSDRIGNFRVYMIGGGKVDVDLSSNSKARLADDMVQIQKYTYGIEGGIGFNFYRKSVTVSPEIKFSSGLNNQLNQNSNLNYSKVLNRIQSRMVIFSIHLEG